MNNGEKWRFRNFRLKSGDILPEITLAYRCRGTLAPDGKNAVLVTHGYTSGPQMIETGGDASGQSAEGGWGGLIGPGKAIDTDRFFVLCPNMLGSSYGSTNAASIDPRTGNPYGSGFPRLAMTDIVASQRLLLDDLGVKHLVAVIGPSYGGFQAFQWAVTFPYFMDGICPVVTAARVPAAGTGALLARLEEDPAWNGGDYYGHGDLRGTLTRLRVETLKRYGMYAWLKKSLPDDANAEKFLSGLAAQWAAVFDANSLIILRRALEGFDTEPYFGRIRARVLYVLSKTDELFPPSLALALMEKLHKAGVYAEYFEIDSPLGHLASGFEAPKWEERLKGFLDGLPSASCT